jgi:hypothetical protein
MHEVLPAVVGTAGVIQSIGILARSLQAKLQKHKRPRRGIRYHAEGCTRWRRASLLRRLHAEPCPSLIRFSQEESGKFMLASFQGFDAPSLPALGECGTRNAAAIDGRFHHAEHGPEALHVLVHSAIVIRGVRFLNGIYRNAVDLSKPGGYGDFEEVVGGGYRPKVLSGNDWSISDGAAELHQAAEWYFERGVGDVHGYYLTLAESCIAAEQFEEGPYRVEVAGSKIKVALRLSLTGA